MNRLHKFDINVDVTKLPVRFTYPFHYEPHPLVIRAKHILLNYLATRQDWADELQHGKMFGILVVKNAMGEIGFLTAFSGNLAHANIHDYFVPPIYDLLNPDGFFKDEEAEVSAVNKHISVLELDLSKSGLESKYDNLKVQAENRISEMRNLFNADKLKRDERRRAGLSPAESDLLLKESQFQKAELKRLKRQLNSELQVLGAELKARKDEISNLKKLRADRSFEIQLKIFRNFKMLNGLGEEINLIELFKNTPQGLPPAGAGECAAPKLIQYAFLNNLTPIAMGEFWYGNSPKGEIRHDGKFYPACTAKCKPILTFMLKGIDVEDNKLCSPLAGKLNILYEDDYIIAVDKPHGVLSVPGKEQEHSIYSLVKKHCATALPVHRLDMATSGILLFPKSKEIHKLLQQQFLNHTIKKTYVAITESVVAEDEGEIILPLIADYDNRPYQAVSKNGKYAHTKYRVIKRTDRATLIEFQPLTGRTHQLRVHSAHSNGLNSPILGDALYGSGNASRLHLHAQKLSFIHPVTGNRVVIESKVPFDI